jgi:hypothetical protein
MAPDVEFYKICTYIPAEYSDLLMDSITEIVTPMYPGYDRTFTLMDVKGTWRALKDSKPYNGQIGKITTAEEVRIEFSIHSKDLKVVMETILRIHPYEEPAIDILPMIGWKSITDHP